MDPQADILLVDDQPASLAALDATLEPLGQRLHQASSGRQALKLLLERDFAVVLLDVRMPGMDGFETARLIRERPRSSRTPIIFLTGIDQGRLPEFRAYALGAVDYLVKPFEPEILRSKVSVLVELAQKTEQVRLAAEMMRERERQDHEQVLLRSQVEASSAQRAWLDAVFDAMPTPLLLLEPPAMVPLFANRAARTLAAGAFWEPHASNLELLDAGGAPLPAELAPARRLARGEALMGETIGWRLGSLEGQVQVFSERLGAVFGHTETVLLSLLDVTDLKLLERELRRAVQAREDFLAVGSHELRTPLTALKFLLRNQVTACGRPGYTPERALDGLRKIEKSVDRLVRLSDYLLDVSRLSAAKLYLNLAPVELSALLVDVVERHRPELEAVGIAVSLHLSGEATGWWDRARLDQLVSNLLDNARKYAPGAPLELTLESSDGQAQLTVRDHGPGIPELRLAHVFERFTRAQAPDDARGFGLGLWIVAQLAERHGGTVTVESGPAGSAFTVTLPTRHAAPSPPAVGDRAAG